MDFIVKITTKINFLDLLCPYYCRGCGSLGEVFCECCKNDLILNFENFCPICYKKVEDKCDECEIFFDGLWVCGFRDEVLGELVEEYKYKSVRRNSDILAEILSNVFPCFNEKIIVVPLPTIQKHVRERGLDHTLEIAKNLAKKRKWQVEKVLRRSKNTVQVGSDMKDRKKQAEKAYILDKKIETDAVYLLIDDVWTTGSSMMAAAKLLRKNGARRVIGGVLVVNRNKLFSGSLGFGSDLGGCGSVGCSSVYTNSIKDKINDSKGKY